MLAAMVGTTCCASLARFTWAPALFQNVLIVLFVYLFCAVRCGRRRCLGWIISVGVGGFCVG
jgi:hypothetical protein